MQNNGNNQGKLILHVVLVINNSNVIWIKIQNAVFNFMFSFPRDVYKHMI